MSRIQGAIAATRFGMGARPGEIEAASGDPRGWLKAQIFAGAAMPPAEGLLSSEQVLDERRDAYAGMDGGPRPVAMDATDEQRQQLRQMIQREARDGLAKEVEARGRFATGTDRAFAERWARFWSNHFTVATRSAQMIGLVGPFEREAIRPYMFGSFTDLLNQASFHPAMLVYLDAARSIGPNSPAGKRRNGGLNENLAREILELHTMGVGSGYSQADIVEFAKALTGWTIGGRALGGGGKQAQTLMKGLRAQMETASGQTTFVEILHEPGARTLLGKTYSGAAKGQAGAILDDLAASPATARHVAVKLARHFVADAPPESAIAKLQDRFMETRGDLGEMAKAVVDLDEAWGETPQKFKTPEELLVSVARSTGRESAFGKDQRGVYQALGHLPFSAPSPAGWPDTTTAWAGPDAIKKRLEWANAVSRRMTRSLTPSDFIESALGPLAGDGARMAVARAESAEQGFTLALMSPEFQRR